MFKRVSIFLVLFLFPLLASASYWKIALNWKAEPQFGGFYEAQRAGLFKEEKLNIRLLEGGSGTPTVQMLANGRADFAVVSAEEILIQNDRNPKAQIVAIFASFQTSPVVIMSHADRKFQNIKDVFENPGVIALQSGLSYAQFLQKKFGKPKARVVPYLGGISHFLQDTQYSQQGFLTSEPIAAKKAGKNVSAFLVAEEGFNPYVTVLAVRKDFLEKNRQKITRLVSALRKGWEQYLLHPDPANTQMAQLNKAMDLETFRLSAEAQASLIRNQKMKNFKIGSMTKERWSELQDQMHDLGLIKSKVDVQTVFENL